MPPLIKPGSPLTKYIKVRVHAKKKKNKDFKVPLKIVDIFTIYENLVVPLKLINSEIIKYLKLRICTVIK